jgi:hypothetical protein
MALWQRPRRGTGSLSFFAPAAVKVTTTPNARLRQRRGAAVWGATGRGDRRRPHLLVIARRDAE